MVSSRAPAIFVSRLRAAVKAAGGPSKVSRLADISPRTLGLYLAGSADPKIGKIAAVARVCDVSLDWLAGLDARGQPSLRPRSLPPIIRMRAA